MATVLVVPVGRLTSRLFLVVAVALVAAACGGGASVDVADSDVIPADEPAVPTTAPIVVDEDAAEDAAAAPEAEAVEPTEVPAPVEEPTEAPVVEEDPVEGESVEEDPVDEPETQETEEAPAEEVPAEEAPLEDSTADDSTAAPEPTATPVPEPTATPIPPTPTPVPPTPSPEPPPAPAVNVPELNGAFATVGGGQIDLGSLQGQDVILWFWAPW